MSKVALKCFGTQEDMNELCITDKNNQVQVWFLESINVSSFVRNDESFKQILCSQFPQFSLSNKDFYLINDSIERKTDKCIFKTVLRLHLADEINKSKENVFLDSGSMIKKYPDLIQCVFREL